MAGTRTPSGWKRLRRLGCCCCCCVVVAATVVLIDVQSTAGSLSVNNPHLELSSEGLRGRDCLVRIDTTATEDKDVNEGLRETEAGSDEMPCQAATNTSASCVILCGVSGLRA
jgi:hypothetical protein